MWYHRKAHLRRADQLKRHPRRIRTVRRSHPVRSVEAAIHRVVSYEGRECPAILAGAAVRSLLRRSERLRSRDPVLAGLVQRSVRAAARQADLARQRICMVLHQWRQDHFRQVPRKLAAFSQEFERLSQAANLVPPAVKSYLDRRDIATLDDVRHRELAVEHEMGTRSLVGSIHIFQANRPTAGEVGSARARPLFA